jgi:hypothetical protein
MMTDDELLTRLAGNQTTLDWLVLLSEPTSVVCLNPRDRVGGVSFTEVQREGLIYAEKKSDYRYVASPLKRLLDLQPKMKALRASLRALDGSK